MTATTNPTPAADPVAIVPAAEAEKKRRPTVRPPLPEAHADVAMIEQRLRRAGQDVGVVDS